MGVELSRQRIESIEAEMDAAGVRDIYDDMVANGNHPNMAAMLAVQRAPGTWNTEREFSRVEMDRMKNLPEMEMTKIQSIAKRAGIVTTGKTYNGQLGKYSDPRAWVADTHDVKKSAIDAGLEIDGMVKVNAYKGPKPKTRIAPDILNRLERQARASDKLLDEKCKKNYNARQALRESLTNKHTKPK
jgi:hypothetical protein